VLAAGTAAHAADSGVKVSAPWMRLVVPSRPAAGYFTLSNDTAKAQVLIGAASPACGMLMLHQSVQQNGMDRMSMVKSVRIPAHGDVKFAPGGYHLMCMSPSKDMTPGHSVPVTLRFADGSSITTSFPVRGATGK
jgi:copper(I)-binding protein